MLSRRFLVVVIGLAMVAAFVVGLAHLFRLRFERGDVYPPYSSLRTDPLGTKALHDSLAELPGLDVRRNYKPIRKLRDARHSTILIVGVTGFEDWSRKDLDDLKFMAASGNRVVVTMRARSTRPDWAKEHDEGDENEENEGEEEKQDGDEMPDRGIGTVMTFLPGEGIQTAYSASAGLPAEISWHSVVGFAESDPGWRYLYRVGEWPVMMERKFGDGSLVLATDSYFLSNEALRDERHADLLAWVTGRHPTVIFDEFHNGISEATGVMSLVRKYQLRPLGFALALIVGLFLWKNAVPFLPQRCPTGETGMVHGKDSAQGFVNLLRRSVPPRDLLGACVAQWRSAFAYQQNDTTARLDAVFGEIEAEPAKRRDPVEGYRKIARCLARKKGEP